MRLSMRPLRVRTRHMRLKKVLCTAAHRAFSALKPVASQMISMAIRSRELMILWMNGWANLAVSYHSRIAQLKWSRQVSVKKTRRELDEKKDTHIDVSDFRASRGAHGEPRICPDTARIHSSRRRRERSAL